MAVALWAPVILQCLPEIVKIGQSLYALWRTLRGNRQQNDSVLRAMKLLNRYQGDIDRVLQDPQRKRDLLEGLTILMNKVNERNTGAGRARALAPPADRHSSHHSSSTSSSHKKSGWKMCDVCYSDYNTTTRTPTILSCGHTFCKECLAEVVQRGPLLCPTCRMHETRHLGSLPPNTALMRVLEEEVCYKDDDSCCGGSGSGCGSEEVPLTYEQQIQYAIFLSQQQAEQQGAEYVESSWREVLEAEDKKLAQTLQMSEVYTASRLCAQRQEAEGADGALNPPDKKQKAAAAAAVAAEVFVSDNSASCVSVEEDASLQLALELQLQEVVMMEKLRSSGGGSRGDGGGCGGGGGDWMEEYQNLFGTSLLSHVDDEGKSVNEGQKEVKDEREEEKGEDEEDRATCCGRSEDDGECGRQRRDDSSRERCVREEGKDGDEDGAVCCRSGDDGQGGRGHGDDNSDEVCENEYLKAEEDLLVQMAVRLSLEQHGAASATK